MKLTARTFAVAVGTILATLVLFSVLTFIPHEARAAGLSGGEQYKIVDAAVANAALETTLNQLGQQGWKVRATLGAGGIIMAK